jgi:hypothetical protein
VSFHSGASPDRQSPIGPFGPSTFGWAGGRGRGLARNRSARPPRVRPPSARPGSGLGLIGAGGPSGPALPRLPQGCCTARALGRDRMLQIRPTSHSLSPEPRKPLQRNATKGIDSATSAYRPSGLR